MNPLYQASIIGDITSLKSFLSDHKDIGITLLNNALHLTLANFDPNKSHFSCIKELLK